MNLFNLKHRYDFGHELYIQLFFTNRWALIQFSVSWCDYSSWPYIQIQSGGNGLLSVLFWAYKFGFDIDVFSRTWKWNHLEKMDEDETELV